MRLNDTTIRTAKPLEKPYKLSDGGGLYLLVTERGTKLWRLAYRFNSKQKSLAFGPYPEVTLANARQARDTARKVLANGGDPSFQRKLKQDAQSVTFRSVADEMLEVKEREGQAVATLKKKRWLLGFAFAFLGDRPIAEVTAPEVLHVLRQIVEREHYETALRLRSTCGMVFRYAIATARAERDPTADLRGALPAPKVQHRAAILEPDAIGNLLRAMDTYEGRGVTAFALRLAPLVFVRPGELRQAEWKEFNLEAAEWRIPAEKTKMRRPHRVPLSSQAVAILKELHQLTGSGRWLFPSAVNFQRPLSENTINAALRRLGFTSTEMCAHGFRAMAATRLTEMGQWSREAVERQMAHEEQNAVRRAYTHGAEHWTERVAMMQAWADYLDGLRGQTKIVYLPKRTRKSA
jgi:integrase